MPKPLQPGDKIGLVALARKISLPDIEPAIATLQSWGLEVVLGKTLQQEYNYFAGTDEERITDFQDMLDNPEIKAIISARGGYGTTRIIDHIDFDNFRKHPKWLIGFSDITALLCHVHKWGIESIHGTMPVVFAQEGGTESVESLRRVLFNEPLSYALPKQELNITGEGIGELIGGNLTLLVSIIGTSSDIDTAGKILFIEDLDEYLYHIDRMMTQLDRAGKLKNLAGLLVGHFSDMKDTAIPFNKSAYQIIQEFALKYNFPVCFGFPTGHQPQNLALVCSRKAVLRVDDTGTTLHYIADGLA